MRINGINPSNSFPLFRGNLTLESNLFNEKNGYGLSFSLQGEKVKVVKIKDNIFEVSLRRPKEKPRIFIVKAHSGKIQISSYQPSSKTAVMIYEKKLFLSSALNLTQQLQIIGKTVAANSNHPPVSATCQSIYNNIVSQAQRLPYLN